MAASEIGSCLAELGGVRRAGRSELGQERLLSKQDQLFTLP
jgi:hypothetical protein